MPDTVDVLLNAGEAGSAWSGGPYWADERLIETLTAWVHGGGIFLGVGAPSALEGQDTLLRMAHVLGVDLDNGDRCCHGRWPAVEQGVEGLETEGMDFPVKPELYLTDGKARVLLAGGQNALVTTYRFGAGMGVYLTGFRTGPIATRWLQRLLTYAAGCPQGAPMTDTPFTECAVYPKSGKLALINNAECATRASATYQGIAYDADLAPFGMAVLDLAVGEADE